MNVPTALSKALKAIKKFVTTQQSLDQGLIEAVRAGDIAKVKKAAGEGANPSATTGSWGGESPLMIAVEAGNMEMLKTLLELKADPNARTVYRSRTPLTEAVQKGANEMAAALVTAGADVNSNRESGYTPFLLAVATRNKTLIDLFVSKDAAVDVVNDKGWSPLTYAIRNGDEATIALLLAKNVRTDRFDEDGQSLYDIAKASDKLAAYKLVQAHIDALVPKWQKPADPDEVAHISILREQGYRLTEVFNLRTQRLTTITHNFETGRDETVTRGLNDGDKAAVAEATQKLAALKPQMQAA